MVRSLRSALLAFALLQGGEALAQDYVVTQRPEAFAPLATGMVVLDPNTAFDDDAAMVEIGFRFRYFGTEYDWIAIGENGAIQIASACAPMGMRCDLDENCNAANVCERIEFPPPFLGFPDPDPPNRVVAAFYDDLALDTSAPASDVRTALIGTAPNRERVIEFRNMRHALGPGGATASRATFQIRLVEGGTIRFHYGPFTPGVDSTVFSGPIGLESPDGMTAIPGHPCAQNGNFCGASDLVGLVNQVIQLGRPNAPELLATYRPDTGARPGEPARFVVRVENAGLQPATMPFGVDVYLTLQTSILPGRDTRLGGLTLPPLAAGASRTATLTAVVPANLPIGYYRSGIVIDPANVIPEASEQNNTLIANGQFLVGSELSAMVSGPRAAAAGARTQATLRLDNLTSAIPAVGWEIWLSRDAMLSMDDVLLRRGRSGVPSSGSTTVTATVALPAMLSPDRYRFIAVVDPANEVAELDENNNRAASDAFVVGPDLAIPNVMHPARTGLGAPFTAAVLLSNAGSAVSAATVELFLSSDMMLTPATDTALASRTASIAAETQRMLTMTSSIPATLMNGNYYLIAVVDRANAVAESDDTNNTWISPTPIMLVGADLEAADVSGGPRAFRGLTYPVHVRIENAGGAPAGPFVYSVHLSNNTLITVTDPIIYESAPTTLATGQILDVTHQAAIPAGFAPGTYYLGLLVDTTEAVAEDLENNNSRRQQATVEVRDPAPDFTATDVHVPMTGAAGEPLVIERVLENQGNAGGMLTYAIELVPAAGGAGARIGVATTTLAAGRSSSGVDTVTVTSTVPPGAYLVVYRIDPYFAVDELEEGNNRITSAERVLIEPAQLSVVTRALPLGIVGLPYEAIVESRGGIGAITWTLASGMLPAGILLEPRGANVALRGQPQAEGVHDLVLRASDGASSAEAHLRLVISSPSVGLEVVTRAVPPIFVGRPYEYPLVAIGGVPPYRWSTSDTLPRGLTLTSSGAISGTPVMETAAAVVGFRVTDATGESAERAISLRVVSPTNAVQLGTMALGDGVVGRPYDQPLTATGGNAPYGFSVAAGDLPPGLMIMGAKVTGIPSVAGTFTPSIRVTDARGDFDTNLFVIVISADQTVRFVTKALPAALIGVEYLDEVGRTVQIKAIPSGAAGSVTYALASGSLPPGLRLESDGRVRGTPSETGLYAFIVRASDEAGTEAFAAFGIPVTEQMEAPPPVVTSTSSCGCTSARAGSEGSGWAVLLSVAALLGFWVSRKGAKAQRGFGLVGLGLVFLAPSSARAQGAAARYFPSERMEAYVARSGGTPIPWPSADDDQAEVMLPFPFRFYENTYNRVTIGTNGYVTFSMEGDSLATASFPDPGAPNDLIALYWDDLVDATGTTHVEGTAPNRVFIIQYASVEHFFGSGGSFDVQLWLFEGPAGRFEIHFGPAVGIVDPAEWSGAVGYEDATGMRGHNFLMCNPQCNGSDLMALNGRVLVSLQDAGEDVVAGGLELAQRGDPVRVYQAVPFATITTVASYHASPIGPFVYTLHLVARGETVPMRPILTSSAVTLPPYMSLSLRNAVTIPLGTPPGRYRLAVVVDAMDQIREPDETNNLAFAPGELIVAEREPDFVARSVTFGPGPVAPGDRVTVTAVVENAGNLDASTSYRVVLSPNRAPSTADLSLLDASAVLALRTSTTVTRALQIPASVPPGHYAIGLIADPVNVVREISEVNNAAVAQGELVVAGPTLEVTTMALPPAFVGIDYAAPLSASGGDGVYTWRLASGNTPAGVNLLPGTNTLRGRPTTAGASSFTVEVRSGNQTAMRTLSVEVQPIRGPLTIVTRELLPAVVGQAYPPAEANQPKETQQHVIAVGGAGPARFRLLSGGPAGLVLDPDGWLHGTAAGAGRYGLMVAATDGTSTVTRSLDLSVVEAGRLTLISARLPDARIGETYVYGLNAVGRSRTATATFTLLDSSGPLPDGLALGTSGEISGTPMRAGTWTFAVEVSEPAAAGGARDSALFTLTVLSGSGFTIAPSSVPEAVVGEPYTATFEARGGTAPFTWRVVQSVPLPRGLTPEVVQADGVEKLRIKGTPEEVPGAATTGAATNGAVTVLLTVQDAVGRKAEAPIVIRVVEPAAPPPMVVDSGGCSCGAARGGGEAWLSFALLALAGLLKVGSRRGRR